MQFRTKNTLYTLIDMGDGGFMISGHPKYCPTGTPVKIYHPPTVGASFWFQRIHDGKLVATSPVQEIIQ